MRRYLSFVTVGALAATAHFSTAVLVVTLTDCNPLLANGAGYCVALLVSFFGQSRFTFAKPHAGAREFARLALASLTAFTLNTLGYAALLHWTTLDYRVALLLMLLAVSAMTFLLMSRWVFARVPART
jgi:putative flippase GtrA